MEGNTYSLLDTIALIKYGNHAAGKDRMNAVMIMNHKKAIEYIAEHLDLDLFTIGTAHALLMDGLVQPYEAGLYRNEPVKIQGSSYHPPKTRSDITNAMEYMESTLSSIENPLDKSFYMMTRIPLIQPFIDGNKRTGRIMMNSALIHNNYPPFSFKNVDANRYIHAMIAFYETGDDTMMKNVFLAAYKGAGVEYKYKPTS